MGALPIAVRYFYFYVLGFLPIPGFALVVALYQFYIMGPVNTIFEWLRYVISSFQLSGDFPPLLIFSIFIFWFIIGAIYGLILYRFNRRGDDEPKFGIRVFFLVLISQLIFGYILTYASAMLFNFFIFHKI